MNEKLMKAVIATNPETGEETRYASMKEAAKSVNARTCQISAACATTRKCRGMLWRKEKEN